MATDQETFNVAACSYMPIDPTILITLVVGIVSFCGGIILSMVACYCACARAEEVDGNQKPFCTVPAEFLSCPEPESDVDSMTPLSQTNTQVITESEAVTSPSTLQPPSSCHPPSSESQTVDRTEQDVCFNVSAAPDQLPGVDHGLPMTQSLDERQVTLSVKKYTVFGECSNSGQNFANLISGKLVSDGNEDKNQVKWIRVDGHKDKQKFVKKWTEEPEFAEIERKLKESSFELSFVNIFNAVDVINTENIPEIAVSAFATGVGVHYIVFPLDFSDELLGKICEAVRVINCSVYRNQGSKYSKSKVISNPTHKIALLGTYNGLEDLSIIKRKQKEASDRLNPHLPSTFIPICPDSDSDTDILVWAIDLSGKESSSLQILKEELEDQELKVSVPYSWVVEYNACINRATEKKGKWPLHKCDEMLRIFELLGWFVAHGNHVFHSSYLCAPKLQKLDRAPESRKIALVDNDIGELFESKGIAVLVSDRYLVPCVLPECCPTSEKASAAPLYLSIMQSYDIIENISIYVFWKMIGQLLKAKSITWLMHGKPKSCNAIVLKQVGKNLDVRILLWKGVIRVHISRPASSHGKDAKSTTQFALDCQSVRNILTDSLVQSADKIGAANHKCVYWGFECSHECSNGMCLTCSDSFNPENFNFPCTKNIGHHLVLNDTHKVWFQKGPSFYQLKEDGDILVVDPRHTKQPDIAAESAPFDQEAFMDKYMDRFMKYVPAEAVALKWELNKIIHKNTTTEIKRALPSEQSEILFKYIRTHGSLATIRKMCDFMIETGKDGYPNMKALGEKMKEDLKQYQ